MATSNTKSIKDFTSGPLLSKIILFSLPLIATSVLNLLFNTADTIVVGRWGGETPEASAIALAAVGSCGSLINLIINLFMGLSIGAGVCVAHAIGARRFDDLDRIVHTSVIAATVGGVIVSIFGYCTAEPLLRMMGTEESVLSQAVPYMKAYFTGMTASMIYNYCASILRSMGDTVRPLIFLSISGIANVALNLVMVLLFHQGARGVGIATSASQWISCILILWYMARKDSPCRICPSHLRVDGKMLRKIIAIGIPAGLQGTLFSISNVTIQASINSLGKTVVAGHTAASNLNGYIYATQNSIYNAALTFIGQNAGACKYDRIKKSAFYCLGIVTVIGVFVGGMMTLFGEPLLSLYAPGNSAVIEKGMVNLRLVGLTHFICGIMEVGCGCVRGMGKSFTTTVISLLGSCVSRIVWVAAIFPLAPIGLELQTLYLCYPISWLITAIAHFTVFFMILAKIKKKRA